MYSEFKITYCYTYIVYRTACSEGGVAARLDMRVSGAMRHHHFRVWICSLFSLCLWRASSAWSNCRSYRLACGACSVPGWRIKSLDEEIYLFVRKENYSPRDYEHRLRVLARTQFICGSRCFTRKLRRRYPMFKASNAQDGACGSYRVNQSNAFDNGGCSRLVQLSRGRDSEIFCFLPFVSVKSSE